MVFVSFGGTLKEITLSSPGRSIPRLPLERRPVSLRELDSLNKSLPPELSNPIFSSFTKPTFINLSSLSKTIALTPAKLSRWVR